VPSKAKPDKRDAILNAMLDLVVERGFHNAPMSVLAKKAGVSAGIIYHYFPSKEDLIAAVYQRVRSIKRAALLDGYPGHRDPKEALIQVWMNAYRFYRDHPKETRFLDQYESSPFACIPGPERDSDPIQSEIQKRFRSRKRGGMLNDLPPEVVQELTFGLALRLAKKPKTLSRPALKAVAEKIWRAISED
jgi:AcrR family transcriptional regulator